MNPWPVDAEVDEVHLPRPGHADLAGDPEVRAHGRPQRARARVARARPPRGWRPGRSPRRSCASSAWRCARTSRGSARSPRPAPERPERRRTSRAWTSRPCARLDADASEAMVAEIDAARKANESLGGEFEVIAFGLVPGIGSHVSWEERLDGRLAQAIMSIQALKGVGDRRRLRARRARGLARRTTRSSGRTSAATTARPTAPAGIEGGMTTGDPLVVRGRDEAAADAHEAAPLAWTPRRRSRPRRCASAPTPAPCPPPAWWGRRWWRSCSRRPIARSSAATTSTTARRRCGRTRSASAGGAASRRASCSWASWAPASPPAPARWPRSSAPSRSTPTASSSGGSASRSRRSSTARARTRSVRARRRSCSSCSRGRSAAVIALGGGALGSERVREALAPAHRRPPRGRARRGLAAGVRQGPAARARPRPLRAAARRPRGRSTRRWPTRCCRPASATPPRARFRRCARSARRRRAHASCGRRRRRASTRCSWGTG